MFYIRFFYLKMSNSLFPSFLVNDVSQSLRSLTKKSVHKGFNYFCEFFSNDLSIISVFK